MTDHVGYESGDPAGHGSGNNRVPGGQSEQLEGGGVGCETPQDRCFMTAYVDDDIIVSVTTDAGGDETLVIARFR